MNIKRLLALCLALCLTVCLCACGGTQNEEPSEEAPQPSNQPQQTETTEPSEENQNTNPVYTVKIVDEAGNPVVGAMVQMCQGETCMPGPLSGSDGTVTFQVAESYLPDYRTVWAQVAAEMFLTFLCLIPAHFIVRSIRAILCPMKAGEPFHNDVSLHLSKIARYVCALGIGLNLAEIIGNILLITNHIA